MNEELLKQLEERSTLKESLLDGKVMIWISKVGKIDYDELYKTIIALHLAK